MASPAAKRDREAPTSGTPANSAPQYLEEKGQEKIVKNSPYGSARRQALGWGNPFSKPIKAVSPKYPGVRIGLSSLNGTPGKERGMDKLLRQYMKKFSVLEHCQPYHAMGAPEQWEKWAGMVPADFVFTVKCNQFLTHTKMLNMDDDLAVHIEHFFGERVPRLGKKLGCVLLQLPPQFRFSEDHLARVKAVGNAIGSRAKVAVEFRHGSWFNDKTYDTLRALKWALVATHNPDMGDSPVVDTGAGFMYCRLHGAVDTYAGDYGAEGMQRWAHAIRRFAAKNGADAPVYFFLNNNESHIGGLTSSVVDGTSLATLLEADEAPIAAPASASAGPAPAAGAATPSVAASPASAVASPARTTQPPASASAEIIDVDE